MPKPGWTQTPQVAGRYWLQYADTPRREPLLVSVYQSDGLWGFEYANGEFVYLASDPDVWLWGPVVAPGWSELPDTPDVLVTPQPATTWVLGKVTPLGPATPRVVGEDTDVKVCGGAICESAPGAVII